MSFIETVTKHKDTLLGCVFNRSGYTVYIKGATISGYEGLSEANRNFLVAEKIPAVNQLAMKPETLEASVFSMPMVKDSTMREPFIHGMAYVDFRTYASYLKPLGAEVMNVSTFNLIPEMFSRVPKAYQKLLSSYLKNDSRGVAEAMVENSTTKRKAALSSPAERPETEVFRLGLIDPLHKKAQEVEIEMESKYEEWRNSYKNRDTDQKERDAIFLRHLTAQTQLNRFVTMSNIITWQSHMALAGNQSERETWSSIKEEIKNFLLEEKNELIKHPKKGYQHLHDAFKMTQKMCQSLIKTCDKHLGADNQKSLEI